MALSSTSGGMFPWLPAYRTEPFITYPSPFRSVVHAAVAATCAENGFAPTVAMVVAETATLISFVAGIAAPPHPQEDTRTG